MHIFLLQPVHLIPPMWDAAVATNYFNTHCWLALPGAQKLLVCVGFNARILITSVVTKITRLQNQFDCTQ